MSPTGCRCQSRRRRKNKVNHDLTYLDCWDFIAPMIPVTDDQTSKLVYVMTYHALNEAEKRRVEKEKRKKCGEKSS